ncbi:hypothetical protein ACQY1Q_05905 [Tenacibaculum sp. TC6]|uniref:hypothetical protein n=1 Tax=Tenacibaculum sp. TC6 TaxID=3423223 RepID=UPI003D366C01
MNTIVLRLLVTNSSTNEQGFILFDALQQAQNNDEPVILHIDSDLPMSSSFLNTSIGKFLDTYGIIRFKEIVKFKGSKSQFLKLTDYIQKYKELYLV